MAIRTDRIPPRFGSPVIVAAAIGVFAMAANMDVHGGEPAPVGSARPSPFLIGARHCAPCHNGGYNQTITPAENEALICRMVESVTFHEKDKHELAFKALSGLRGQEMTRALKADVREMAACLACHATTAPAGGDVRLYDRERDGVTCVSCHGAAEEWVARHQFGSTSWARLTRREKEDKFGMIDLWDPVRRAETCTSCHVGSREEGKVVTHEMYAAGHPPLPSIEVSSFGEAEPRHWQTLREKSPKRLERLGLAGSSNDLEQTRQVVIGGLVGLRASMRLMADRPGAAVSPATGADFARFDCTACHHELRRDDDAIPWRQVRRVGSIPGRPTTPDWPLVLARLGVEGRQNELDGRLSKLREGLGRRPFGDESTPAAARAVADWADAAIRDFSASPIDEARAFGLLDRLARMAIEAPPDYDSARQIAWAFRAIYHEVVPSGRQPAEIEAGLKALSAELLLDLPPSQTKALIVPTSLSRRLEDAAAFDPAAFREHFRRIAGALTSAPATRTVSRDHR